MAWIERRNDTDPAGLAYYGRELHNLWAVKKPHGGWAHFASYESAARHWATYVLGPTYADLTTLREFVHQYAPVSENDPERYVHMLVQEINALPEIVDAPAPEPAPWSPVIYDLRNDTHAARFGLTPAARDRILAKKIPGRNGMRPQAIGLHVQWGNTTGSLQHWLGVNASATVMVQRDGSILKVIPEADGPWTQGDVKHPSPRAQRLMDRFGDDPNVYSLTIEAEDERTEQINALQTRTILWQIRQWQQQWPHLSDPERIVGHFEINSVDRNRCGRYRDAIVRELAAGTPLPPAAEFPGLPPWLPAPFFRAAFPLADPAGVVTRAVIAWSTEHGQIPWWMEKVDVGAGQNLWRFDRVTFCNDGARVWREGDELSAIGYQLSVEDGKSVGR
ncbi:MAG: N-acetylmuramoyl-L-alanine amidase [Thermomicrobiales bacterium]